MQERKKRYCHTIFPFWAIENSCLQTGDTENVWPISFHEMAWKRVGRTQAEMSHTCQGTMTMHGETIITEDSRNFVVSNGDSRTWHLRASTEGDRQRWVKALELAKAIKMLEFGKKMNRISWMVCVAWQWKKYFHVLCSQRWRWKWGTGEAGRRSSAGRRHGGCHSHPWRKARRYDNMRRVDSETWDESPACSGRTGVLACSS